MHKETLTFAQLAEWSRGRYAAGQHQAADDVMTRAVEQAAIEHKGKTVVRDPKTGVLSLTGAAATTEDDDELELWKLELQEQSDILGHKDSTAAQKKAAEKKKTELETLIEKRSKK